MIYDVYSCLIICGKDLSEVPLGVIELTEVDDKKIHIYYIEINRKYRYKGIGRQVIDLLKDKYDIIEGKSVLDSIEFWHKLGAKFEEDIHNQSLINKYFEEGLCIPFEIRK